MALLLKQFSFSLGGNASDWYCTLHEMMIATLAQMDKQLLEDQLKHRHNPEFLGTQSEDGKTLLGPLPRWPEWRRPRSGHMQWWNKEEVAPVNRIRLKGVAKKLEVLQNTARQVQTWSKSTPPPESIPVLRSRRPSSKPRQPKLDTMC